MVPAISKKKKSTPQLAYAISPFLHSWNMTQHNMAAALKEPQPKMLSNLKYLLEKPDVSYELQPFSRRLRGCLHHPQLAYVATLRLTATAEAHQQSDEA